MPAPKQYTVDNDGDLSHVDFPVLVRPQVTRHGVSDGLPKATEITGAAELTQLIDQFKNADVSPNICQSLLRSNVRQYSVGVARNSEGIKKMFVAEKIRPGANMCAGGTYVVGSPERAIEELASRTADALGLYGICEIEIIKDVDRDELYLIEVNVRPWVQYALVWKSGYDFLTFLLKPELYDPHSEREIGGRWLSFWDDLILVFSRSSGMYKKKEISISGYLKSVMSANVFVLWDYRDPIPSIMKLLNRCG